MNAAALTHKGAKRSIVRYRKRTAVFGRLATRRRAIALLVATLALSVAAAPDPFKDAMAGATLVDVRRLDGEVFHVQGLALDARSVWVTSVDRLRRRGYLQQFDRRSGALVRRLELTDGARYHPGGLSLAGRSIWVPVAEMRANSSAVLVEIDADTLRVRRRIFVADHLGCVAAKGDTLVAGNWDSRLFYIIDPTGRKRVRIVLNPSPTHYQDMKFVDGQIVAGGDRGWWSGTVDWLSWPSLRVARSLRAGAISPIRSYAGEGMAIEGRDLYVTPEDGAARLFHFSLNATIARTRGKDQPARTAFAMASSRPFTKPASRRS